jgi:hypothetical protein
VPGVLMPAGRWGGGAVARGGRQRDATVLRFGDEVGVGDARSMAEHRLPADVRHHDQQCQPHEAEQADAPVLDRRQPSAPPQLPHQQHREQDHQVQGEPLVPLHQLVDRLPVVDRVFRHASGDVGRPAADHPGPQGPEPDRPQGLPLQRPAGQIEEHGGQEQGGGQVVE